MIAEPEAADSPLCVAYVTMLFPAGSETFASLDVRELTRKGLDVEVHSLRPKRSDTDRLARERGLTGVRTSFNGFGATSRGLGRMLNHPRESAGFLAWLIRKTARRPLELLKSIALAPRVFDIFQSLRVNRPDVVHIYWGHYPAMVGALVQKYLPDVLVSMSLGAYDLEAFYPPTLPVAQAASFVRTHGLCNVPALTTRVGVAPRDVAVVFNGIDLDLAPESVDRPERVPGRMVTAGRLIKSKAVDEVLAVFVGVRAAFPLVTLQVFGDGPERPRLEALAVELGVGDAVQFCGHKGQRELFEALSTAEIFLFMSRNTSERLPNVLKEAMACGAVCVTVESVGLEELIVSRDHGRVVAIGDVAGAVEEATALLRDPAEASLVRSKAREYVVENFDVRRTTDAYVARWRAGLAAMRVHAGPVNGPRQAA